MCAERSDYSVVEWSTVPDGDQKISDSYSKYFKVVVDGAIKLMKGLPGMSDAFEEINKSDEKLNNILIGISADSDPEMRRELIDLQKEYRDFIRIGKNFLQKCLQMAEYATDRTHVEQIKQELKNKILDELKLYAGSILRFLKSCSKLYKKYEKTQLELEESVSKSDQKLFSQAEEATKTATDAQRKSNEAHIHLKNIQSVPEIVVGCTKALAGAGSILLNQPGLHLLTGLSHLAVYITRANEGEKMVDVLEKEKEKVETAIRRKIIEDARNSVSNLYMLMSDASAIIDYIDNNSSCVSRTILEPESGLNDYIDKEGIDYYYLSSLIDSILRDGEKTKNKIGKKGTHPISSDIDTLTSYTQARQATDTVEVSLNAKMKRLMSRTGPPNGSDSNPPSPPSQAVQESGDRNQSVLVVNLSDLACNLSSYKLSD